MQEHARGRFNGPWAIGLPAGPEGEPQRTGGTVVPSRGGPPTTVRCERDRHARVVDASTILERSSRTPGDVSAAFAALSDPARLEILRRLQGGTRCICELAPRLGMAPNLLSYHLRILREAGFVERERRGRRIEYRVRPAVLQALAVEMIGLAIGGPEP